MRLLEINLARHHTKFVSNRKDSRNALGANSRYVLISLVIDNSFKGHVAVSYDDADRLIDTHVVLLQWSITVYCKK